MNPTAIPLGALPPSAATQPLQAVRGPWVPGELLLRRAVRTVNEDLAIVGLRLRLEAAADEGAGGARHYLRCEGEAAPLGGAHALVTVDTGMFRAEFIGLPHAGARLAPAGVPVSLNALCDFLLAIVEALAYPAGPPPAPGA
mgnify:CR=1 FL=1